MRAAGFRWFTMDEIVERGLEEVLDEAIVHVARARAADLSDRRRRRARPGLRARDGHAGAGRADVARAAAAWCGAHRLRARPLRRSTSSRSRPPYDVAGITALAGQRVILEALPASRCAAAARRRGRRGTEAAAPRRGGALRNARKPGRAPRVMRLLVAVRCRAVEAAAVEVCRGRQPDSEHVDTGRGAVRGPERELGQRDRGDAAARSASRPRSRPRDRHVVVARRVHGQGVRCAGGRPRPGSRRPNARGRRRRGVGPGGVARSAERAGGRGRTSGGASARLMAIARASASPIGTPSSTNVPAIAPRARRARAVAT